MRFRTAAPINRALVAAAILFAAGATLYDLGDTPPGLYIDEVAIALTARSLSESGQDLLGQPWPLYPYSFPDENFPTPVNPVFVYSAIPFTAFGPGGWSARLPAVLWLWVAAFGIGLCVLEFTEHRAVAVFIGISSALTPWLYTLGRVAWEAVTFPALTSLAVAFLIRWSRRRRPVWLVIAGLLLGSSLYAYSTARLLVPLTAGIFLLLFGLHRETRKGVWILVPPLFLSALPMAAYMARHPGVLTWRVGLESIWSDEAPVLDSVRQFLSNYIHYFSPKYLFLVGDPNLRHCTGRGMLLWVWVPLIVAGLWQFWRRRREPVVQFVLAALLLTPVGASIMSDWQPHAIRSITAVVFWGIIAGAGLRPLLATPGRIKWAAPAVAVLVLLAYGGFAFDYFGAYRHRAFDRFDAGKGAILQEAFRRGEGRQLFLPRVLYDHERLSVYAPYWGRFPVAKWREEGLGSFGIHAWRGAAPDGSLVLVSWCQEAPDGSLVQVRDRARTPRQARRVSAIEHEGRMLYALFEK